MNILEALEKTREIYFKDGGLQGDVFDPETGQHCIIFSMVSSFKFYGLNDNNDLYRIKLDNILHPFIREEYPEIRWFYGISYINDHYGKEAVLAILDKAINKLKEQV